MCSITFFLCFSLSEHVSYVAVLVLSSIQVLHIGYTFYCKKMTFSLVPDFCNIVLLCKKTFQCVHFKYFFGSASRMLKSSNQHWGSFHITKIIASFGNFCHFYEIICAPDEKRNSAHKIDVFPWFAKLNVWEKPILWTSQKLINSNISQTSRYLV